METMRTPPGTPPSRTLETFLSGMETQRGGQRRAGRRSLETFLSGMETRRDIPVFYEAGEPLKPSLVEWKPSTRVKALETSQSLKPSLVEWKQELHREAPSWHVLLETFLSGMETMRPSVWRIRREDP